MMTKYDPYKHHRRSIRLPSYDYTSPGAYFVTICVHGGECSLGEVIDGEMHLSDWGRLVGYHWQRIPCHARHVALDAWVVMPNHLHGIIVIEDHPNGGGEASPVRPGRVQRPGGKVKLRPGKSTTGDASPLQSMPAGVAPGSLGALVGNFKSVTTRRINRLRRMPGVPFWQQNYWEHIIRSEPACDRIRAYIQDNPERWLEDQLHPEAAPNPFNKRPS